jgi:hypothetical protein
MTLSTSGTAGPVTRCGARIERGPEQRTIQPVYEMSCRDVPLVASALDQHDSFTGRDRLRDDLGVVP